MKANSRGGHRRALVLGATGHIGNAVLRELRDRGYDVTAAMRRDRDPANLRGLDVELAIGDDRQSGSLEGWIRGQALVVDAAAPYPLAHDWSGESFERALERGARILDACREAGSRLAHVSSFATGRRDHGFERLEDRIPRLHSYFKVKQALEDQILRAAEAGARVSIVAPTMCVGPWDLKERRYCMIPNILTLPVAVYTPHVLNVIDVRDVAVALVSRSERRTGPVRLAVSGRNISMDQLYRFVMELGGVDRRLVGIPLGDCVLGAWNTGAPLGGDTPQNQVLLSALLVGQYRPSFPTADQIELGAAPRPLSRSLQDAIAWYRKIGYC